jgi:RNA polymerase sigma-70 factor (ECF subfamily)
VNFEAQVISRLSPPRRYARALTGGLVWAGHPVQNTAGRALAR